MGLGRSFVETMGAEKLKAFADEHGDPILDRTLDRMAAKRRINQVAIHFLRDDAHEFLDTLVEVGIEYLREQ